MDTTRFAGKAVIVTGGGSGIGAAAVRRFWREGAQVVAADLVEDRAAALIAELGAERAFAIKVDVSDYASVEAMVAATLERFGRLDILVANAGVAFKAEVGTTTLEQWRSTLAVDLDGVFYCVRAALPHLLAARGSIVTTASVSGLGGDRRMSAYNAAKGGVVNLTRSLALELGPQGVRVNAVCPTVTTSRMSQPVLRNDGLLSTFHERIPLGRHADADELAGPIAFLASDDASFVNGAILPVDGGLTASNGQP